MLEKRSVACPKFYLMRYLFCLVLLISLKSFADDTTKLYNPTADVTKNVAAVIAKAKKEGKHVLLQAGATGAYGAIATMVL